MRQRTGLLSPMVVDCSSTLLNLLRFCLVRSKYGRMDYVDKQSDSIKMIKSTFFTNGKRSIQTIRLALSGVLLCAFGTACIKSNEPIAFEGYRVSSVTSTPLGYTLAKLDDEGDLVEAYQLRDEGEQIYLYMCPYDTESPYLTLEKSEAFVYAIPEQEGYYVVSLEEGSFILDNRGLDNTAGHEFFVLKPLSDKVQMYPIRGVRENIAESYFSAIQPLSSEGESPEVYSVENIKTFLSTHVDLYWSQTDVEAKEFRYYDVELTQCS